MPDALSTNYLPPVSSSIKDRALAAAAWTASIIVLAVFAWVTADAIQNGWSRLSWTFLTDVPRDAGRAGGIAPIIVSTAMILGVCLAVSLPIGVGAAILLSEIIPATGTVGRIIRLSLDILAGVPSIIFGLFGNAFFCVFLGMGFSIMAGGLTLACMVLPILIRSSEEGLRAVSQEQRLAAAAVGMSRARALTFILLPAAAPGIGVGLVLGLGRAAAETAALLFTSGYVDRMPTSAMDSGRALSVHIYDLAMNVAGGEPNAYAAVLVLMALILAVHAATSALTKRHRPARGTQWN